MSPIAISIVAFLSGMLVLELVNCIFRVTGKLLIDRTSSSKDLYRFEISNLDRLSGKRYIILKVDAEADLSRR